MNNMLTLVLGTVILLGTTLGVSEAKTNTPFGYTSNGVDIVDFELDFEDTEIILYVKITETPSTLKITFERDFFDSRNLEQDSEFTIIADGELVYYDEIVNNSKLRTLQFSLSSDVELVEIFGTHLKGIIGKTPIIDNSEEIQLNQNEQSGKNNELMEENQILRKENNLLKEENKELDGRIFELENLVSALEVQVTNLSTIITEQVKIIYSWVIG